MLMLCQLYCSEKGGETYALPEFRNLDRTNRTIIFRSAAEGRPAGRPMGAGGRGRDSVLGGIHIVRTHRRESWKSMQSKGDVARIL